jgi:hypothetical protein
MFEQDSMQRKKLVVTVTLLLLLVGSMIATGYVVLNQKGQQKPFYVGVTYCGGSIEEAKALIDKVKDYTSLFVLQSGPLMDNVEAMEEIGDYVIASNLSYAVYGSVHDGVGLDYHVLSNWLIEAKERWNEYFIGVYYNDEPGGEMLDGALVQLTPKISKKGGSISIVDWGNSQGEGTVSSQIVYMNNGEIFLRNFTDTIMGPSIILADGTELLGWGSKHAIHYYPDGTITIGDIDGDFYTKENITKCPLPILPYEQVLKQHPIQTSEDAAIAFVNYNKGLINAINKEQLDEKNITVFTSDYSLYWWNYKSGYDVILAELGWNHTMSQDIGLVRGAANLQNKSWGTIITWKYTHAPYLTDGEEMFEQMKTSYEAGAEYVLIFNYSEDQENPNTLQEEHYQALEQFWNDIVQNPKIKHGNIKTEAALVLPQNYGWGMRHPQDTIWGIWPADETSQQIWSQLQSKLEQHGLKLDIVFEDPNYPAAWKYFNIYYWDQK